MSWCAHPPLSAGIFQGLVGLYGDDTSVIVTETGDDSGDSRKERLCPPLQQLVPEDVQGLNGIAHIFLKIVV